MNKVKKLPVKTLHGKAPLRNVLTDITREELNSVKLKKGYEIEDLSTPKFYKPRKDYTPHIIIFILSAIFLYFAFTGQLSGEQLIP